MRLNQAPRFAALFCGIIAALSGLISTASLADPPAQFMGLGDLAGGVFSSSAAGVSADGLTVVGTSTGTNTAMPPFPPTAPLAFKWQSGTMSAMGFGACSYASATSSNGNAVVGGADFNCGGAESYGLYAAGGGFGGTFDAGEYNGVNAVSGDGLVMAGHSDFDIFGSTPRKAARGVFTAPSTITVQNLGTLPGGNSSEAFGISLDGSTIVGGSRATGTGTAFRAFRWKQSEGMISLDPGAAFTSSQANAVSSTGEVVVGERTSGSGTEAFLWTELGGMTGLGDLIGGSLASRANAIDGYGWSIVGVGNTAAGDRAFVWDPIYGVRELSTILSLLGADLTGWTLSTATGISYDGLVIVGTGINPLGQTEAWRAVLPEPATALPLLMMLAFVRRRRFPATYRN